MWKVELKIMRTQRRWEDVKLRRITGKRGKISDPYQLNERESPW
jgi:hypothetical protein